MGAFFEQTTAIKQAVIDGELAATRSPARWLAQHAPPGPHGSPHAVALHDAAKAVGAASTLPAAARAVGSLGQACGDCHTARGVHPRPEGAPTFTDEPAPIEQMHLHQWAADRLWEGLVRPSTEVWRDACDALAGAPLGEDRDDETPRALADAIAGVRAIAERGAEAGPDERAAIYGELLTTCAGCHAARRARE
ncbi:MAG: hypothetical protein KC636_28040 [Myxococcales bacterium]|nr:hypothetical protein [Myxococcales bacterium]